MPATTRFPYSDILGWSISRYDLFTSCRRRYYYQYYGKFDTEYDREQLRQLRELTSLPLQVGSITHDCIASLLKRLQKDIATPVDQGKLAQYISDRTRKTIGDLRFAEVYFKEMNSVDPTDISADVEVAIQSLLNSERFAWISSIAGTAREDWIIEPDKYGETRIDGMKAYCKVDFLFPVGELLHIIDWKTGKEHTEKHATQILGYAAWASFHFEKAVSSIRPVVAYLLPEYRETHTEVGQAEMIDFAEMVREQTNEMYNLCLEVENNIPKPKQSFPMTQIIAFCGYCNFRELCKRA
jgi:hypothetical protein